MFDQENSKMFNLMKVDGENWVISHEDLMNPIIPISFQGHTVERVEYVGVINIPIKYLEKQQPIEPNGEVFELH